MRFLLDTNICIYLLKRSKPKLTQRVLSHRAADFGISSITAAELFFGVVKSKSRESNLKNLDAFLTDLQIMPFELNAAETYGRVRYSLERKGKSIGPNDTLIAAHALSLNLTLLTNNVGEFARVPRLKVENWATE
jgi:tRNA(fMet)-specific endonuclease VapC